MRFERRVCRHRNHFRKRLVEVAQCASNSDIRVSEVLPEPVGALPLGTLGFQNAKCAGDL